MFVDTYSLQHPERYGRSAKSLAAHLVGLGLIVEDGISAAAGSPALKKWLDGARALDKPPLPEARGGTGLGRFDLAGLFGPSPAGAPLGRGGRWAVILPTAG